jgi:hypothetical protein
MSDRAALKLTAALGVILIATAAVWYLSAPPKGEDGYRERAASTAETLRSQVEVVRIWVDAVTDAKVTHAAADVGLEQAESDAVAATSQFERYEPPSSLVGLETEFSSLAATVSDALTALRAAAQQEEWERLGDLARPLPQLALQLDAFEERIEP